MNNKTNIMAFDKGLIKGFYHDDNICHLIIGFPETSKFKDYIWSIPIDRIQYNTTGKEDHAYSFNDDKCWIEVDQDYRFRLFRMLNPDSGDLPDMIFLKAEEMSWRIKPKFPYMDSESENDEG